jgi:hypothetical protein
MRVWRVWNDLPARGSLVQSLHGECVHQTVLAPCLRDVIGRYILSSTLVLEMT